MRPDPGAASNTENTRTAATLAAAAAVLAIGLGATWTVASRLDHAEHQEAQTAFDRLANRAAEEVRRRVTLYEYGLRGGRGAFVARPDLDLDGWRAYMGSRDIGREFFGSLGFGYVARVAPGQQDVFVERLLQQYGQEQYGEPVRIHTDRLPAPEPQGEQWVVEYIEPLKHNRAALGLDLAAEPRRREAAMRAMRTGKGALTAAIELVQVDRPHRGFVYLMPVYHNGAPTATEADRIANLRGWVYTPIVMDEAMAGMDEFTQGQIDVEVFDGEPSLATLLYDADDHLAEHDSTIDESRYTGRHFLSESDLAIAGRTWRLHISSAPAFEARFEGQSARTTWLLGALVTSTLTIVLVGLNLSRRRALMLAARMTRDLTAPNGELEQARRDLDELVQAKGRFLANMSHELRTPMTAILGFSQYLADEVVTPRERADYAGAIQRNGDHMLNLINEVLDSSKIEAGMMRVEQIDTSFAEIVGDVHTVMRSRAEKKGLSFELRWCTRIPDPVRSDPTRVRQILMNLVGNAVKFTEHGGICLEVAHEARATGDRLLVRVVDTGKGMEPEQLERLFRPFMQADDSVARQHGGTGLGLSISKQLAQLLGGDLYAMCMIGKGCCFVLDLPLVVSATTRWLEPGQERAAEPTRAKEAPRLSGRILLVDDGADNRKLIRLVLGRAGAAVATAENGREAVDAVLEAKVSGCPFDLVLMDMQMPVLDGLAATRELRSRGVTTPILALTANALPEDRARAQAAGCEDFLLKPIERERFFATCQRWLAAASPPTTPAR